jgi:hypothetical protein
MNKVMDWLQLYKSDIEIECPQPRLLLSVDLQILLIFDEINCHEFDSRQSCPRITRNPGDFSISVLPTLTNFCNTLYHIYLSIPILDEKTVRLRFGALACIVSVNKDDESLYTVRQSKVNIIGQLLLSLLANMARSH